MQTLSMLANAPGHSAAEQRPPWLCVSCDIWGHVVDNEVFKLRHPLTCFFRHRIRFLARRAGYAEYVCEDCGHPFCFADPAA